MDKVRLSAKFWTFLEVIPNLAVVVVLLLGAIGVGRGALTPGELVAFITLMLSLVWPVASLGVILAMAQEAMTAAARVLEIFDTEPDIVAGDRQVIERPRGHLRFEHVDFAFPDAPDEPVLRDVNLDVAPGETLALVGATGSGKTTLTALVPRLYDVTGGRVTIDGVDVRDLDAGRTCAARRDRVRGADAVLDERPGEPHARPRRRRPRTRSRAALEIAQAGFVHDLPWGLDTRIGEQGMSLSGGQRQRLALARAVLAAAARSWCSTTRCRRSTCTPRSSSRRRCAGCWPRPPASSWPTAPRRCCSPTGSRCSRTAPSPTSATTASCSPRVPAYRDLLAADADDSRSRPA